MKTAVIALAATLFALPAFGQEEIAAYDRNVFTFGGAMGAGDMAEMLDPFGVPYEDALVAGVGYQQYMAEPFDHLRLGLEIGAAVRNGSSETTGEMWGGVVTRYDGILLGDKVRIAPALTFGASVVDDTMGIEAVREAQDGLSGDILFYLSPEISVSSLKSPDSEVFWRLHHRSGAWNTFGGGGSANATTVGLRTNF